MGIIALLGQYGNHFLPISFLAAIISVMAVLPTLRQSLIDTPMPHLRLIARMWGLEVLSKRPLEVAAELAQQLADPAHASDVWGTLSQNERAALRALLSAGGAIPKAVFVRDFGEIRPIGPGRLEREAPWRDPKSPAEGLWYGGLIYAGFSGEGDETYPIYFVPAELQAALPVQAGVPSGGLRVRPAAAPGHHHFGGDLLLDDVTTVLSFIHNETVRPFGTAATTWKTAAKQALSRILRDAEPARIDFILHLLDDLGWTRTAEDGRLRLVPESTLAWLQMSADESLSVLQGAWRQLDDWNELWLLTALQPVETGTWRGDPKLARVALLRHLQSLQKGEWYRIADFIDAIKASDPDFLRPGGDYEQWYIRDATSGDYLTGFASWDQVEGVVLRALLTGPAWWLGLVELGEDEIGGGREVFRRRQGRDAVPAQKPTAPKLQPDFTISMPGERRFERFQLARVADLAVAGDPFVYRLTPSSLARARQRRIDLDKVLDFLDGLSDAPVPTAVRSSVTRWAERGTEVWLERALLLRVTDESVMQQIISAPRTGRFIVLVLSPTSAAVAEKDWPDLVAGLAELGLLAELVNIRDS